MKKLGIVLLCVGLVMVVVSAIVCGGTLSNLEAFNLSSESKTFTAKDIEISGNGDLAVNVSCGSEKDVVTVNYRVYDTTEVTCKDIDNGSTLINVDCDENIAPQFNVFSVKQKVDLILPSNYHYKLKLNVVNGAISIEDATATGIEIATKNGAVKMEDVNCLGDIEVETNNGALRLKRVQATIVTMKADNGAVSIDDLESYRLTVGTLNGAIDCDDVTVKEIKLKTSVGAIDCNINNAKELYTITVEPHTKNCNVENQNGSSDYKLQLDCKIGAVKVTFSD